MQHEEKVIRVDGVHTTMRYFPAVQKRHTLVFFHGLLGDSHSWDVFQDFCAPEQYADCYYVDFHFEALRPAEGMFDRIVDEIRERDWIEHRYRDRVPTLEHEPSLGQGLCASRDRDRQDRTPRLERDLEGARLEAPRSPDSNTEEFRCGGRRQEVSKWEALRPCR